MKVSVDPKEAHPPRLFFAGYQRDAVRRGLELGLSRPQIKVCQRPDQVKGIRLRVGDRVEVGPGCAHEVLLELEILMNWREFEISKLKDARAAYDLIPVWRFKRRRQKREYIERLERDLLTTRVEVWP